jgi:RimJ/RimL family protein N-acetyltransferase
MLTGKQIVLRAIEEADLPTLARWRSDSASYPYFFEFHPISQATQADWFAAQRTRRDEMNFAVTARTGELVGTISLMRIDGRNRRAELGRVFVGEERLRRKRVGREMTFLVLEYAFEHLNLYKVACEVLATNAPACELYRRFGFREEGVLREHVFKGGRFVDVRVLALFAGDFHDPGNGYARACRAGLEAGAP